MIVRPQTLFSVAVLLFTLVPFAGASAERPPELVDLTSPSGRASSSVSFYKGNAGRAFQDNPNLAGGDSCRVIFDRTKSGNSPGCFAYTFDAATVVNSYGMGIMNDNTQCNGREPRVWGFYGSNDYDGTAANIATATWIPLDTRDESGWVRGEYRYFEFDNETAYTSYMIAIEQPQLTSSDNYIQFAYLEFFYNDMVTLSNGSLTRLQNGAWQASCDAEGGGNGVTLELKTAGTDPLTFPAGTLTAEDLAAVDKTAFYSACFHATSESGIVSTLTLPGKFYFGDHATVDLTAFAKRFSITVPSGYDKKGANLVVPVRISPAAIGNFSYGDFQQTDYSDLVFTDAYGNVLPHEVETWNTSGESLVWVRFPIVSGGTVVTCYYGGPSVSVPAAHVWSDYTGVWHLNELTGNSVYVNSSGLGAAADGTKAELSTADQAGKFGKSCRISSAGVKTGEYSKGGVFVPHSSALGFGDRFTVSGWFKHANQSYYYDRMFTKRLSADTDGFSVEMYNAWTSDGQVQVKAASTINPKITWPDTMCRDWAFCTFVFDGASCSVYQNGELVWTGIATGTTTDNERSFTIGNQSLSSTTDEGSCAWCGWVDEVRLSGGIALSAEDVALEYEVGANGELLSFGGAMSNGTSPALIVSSNLSSIGSPAPDYGLHDSSETFGAITSGDAALSGGVLYGCSKYTLETSSDGGVTWTAPAEHAGNSFTYSYDGQLTRVTWLWEPVAVAVEIASSHSSGSLSYSAEPYRTIEGVRYYALGTNLRVTASDPSAVSFRNWLGVSSGVSVTDNVATIVVGTTPVRMTAVSLHAWTYDNRVLTDGTWSFSVSKSSSELTLSTLTEEAPYGILDFTAGISDGSGNALTLVKIEGALFKDNLTLREVALAPGLRQIGWSAFEGCTSLVRFSPLLPSTLTACGGNAFNNCSNLVGELELLGESCTKFPNQTFARTSLSSVRLPFVKDLSEGAQFDYCPCLTNADIQAVEKLGYRSFRGCTALVSVQLGENLTTMGVESFGNCTALKSVTPMLPKSLTTFITTTYKETLNNAAFSGCTNLTMDVRLENKAVGDIYGQIFQNSGITSLYAPYATNVWKFAMERCPGLTNVTFGAKSVNLNAYTPISGNPDSLEVYCPGAAPILDVTSNYYPFGDRDYVRVYGDPQMDRDGWAALMASDSFVALTDADRSRSDYPGEKTLGILTEKMGKKYWLVAYRSPLRPRGMRIYFR